MRQNANPSRDAWQDLENGELILTTVRISAVQQCHGNTAVGDPDVDPRYGYTSDTPDDTLDLEAKTQKYEHSTLRVSSAE